MIAVSAIVTVTQEFWQPYVQGIPHSRYVFPVPARAAICGFRMTVEDGTTIEAVAKDRDEAKEEYEDAARRGRMVGLVEHVTDDSQLYSLITIDPRGELIE